MNLKNRSSVLLVVVFISISPASYCDDNQLRLSDEESSVSSSGEAIFGSQNKTGTHANKIGLEFNLLHILFSPTREAMYEYFSGPDTEDTSVKSYGIAFLYRDVAGRSELTMPFFWYSYKFRDSRSGENQDFSLFSVDLNYRKYLEKYFFDRHQGFFRGSYISGFARYSRLHGRTGPPHQAPASGASGDPMYYEFDNAEHPYKTKNKFGVGVGIGMHKYFRPNFYWGAGMSVGRYLVGSGDQFIRVGVEAEDKRNIVDVEVLRLGYLF